MRKELARYFKAQMEPITREDLSLLAKAGIKHHPFFKSTKGINCLAVFAWNARDKTVMKLKAKANPPYDQKAARLLRKAGIHTVEFRGTYFLPKGVAYAGTEAVYYELKSWAGYDFEISLRASIEALRSVGFDETNKKAKIAIKLIGSDMEIAGHLAGLLYRADLLYADLKPANIAKTNRVRLFDIHEGVVKPSNSIVEHTENALFYLDAVHYVLKEEARPAFEYLWQYAKDSFFRGISKPGKTKPFRAMIEKKIW